MNKLMFSRGGLPRKSLGRVSVLSLAIRSTSWNNFNTCLTNRAEIALVIICGCIPTIKPLFDRAFKGKPLKPSRSAFPSKRSYWMHSNTSISGRPKFISHTGNLTNVTTKVASNIHPADRDFSPQGILVERNVDVVLCDWDSGKDLVEDGTV